MMNERIKELSLQAHETADAIYAEVGGPDLVWWKEYNEKFAELILRECAEVLVTWNRENGAEEGLDKAGLISLWSSHFGVEE